MSPPAIVGGKPISTGLNVPRIFKTPPYCGFSVDDADVVFAVVDVDVVGVDSVDVGFVDVDVVGVDVVDVGFVDVDVDGVGADVVGVDAGC